MPTIITSNSRRSVLSRVYASAIETFAVTIPLTSFAGGFYREQTVAILVSVLIFARLDLPVRASLT